MKVIALIFGIPLFFLLPYFFIMNVILTIKSFKLFWKDRYDFKYEEIWGDRALMFYPLLFPLKKMNKIVDGNEDLKSNKKIMKFLRQVKRNKIIFITIFICGIIVFTSVFIAGSMGASWVG